MKNSQEESPQDTEITADSRVRVCAPVSTGLCFLFGLVLNFLSLLQFYGRSENQPFVSDRPS